MLALLIVVAAGIRLIFILLAPVWPYLLVVLVGVTVWRVAVWWRRRW